MTPLIVQEMSDETIRQTDEYKKVTSDRNCYYEDCPPCVTEARTLLIEHLQRASVKHAGKTDTQIYSSMLDRDPQLKLKDNKMDFYNDKVEAAIDEVILQRKTADRLAAFDSYGEDAYPDGTVLRFSKTFGEDDKAYLYAALKVGKKWYTTGIKNNFVYTWDELRKWLSEPVPVLVSDLRTAYFE